MKSGAEEIRQPKDCKLIEPLGCRFFGILSTIIYSENRQISQILEIKKS